MRVIIGGILQGHKQTLTTHTEERKGPRPKVFQDVFFSADEIFESFQKYFKIYFITHTKSGVLSNPWFMLQKFKQEIYA